MKIFTFICYCCILQLTSHAQATRPGDSEPIPSAVNFKTTSEGRWYNYVDYMTALDANVSFNAHLPFIWHNADIHCAYQSNGQDSFALVTLRSIGMVFDPISQSTEFNDPVGYPGEMTIRSGDSYFLDRVNILGKYRRNPAKGNVVDTLRFSFIYGLGPTTNLPHYYNAGQSMNFPGNDTVRYGGVWYDSIQNTAKQYPFATATTPDVVVIDKYLDSSVTGDTNALGYHVFEVQPSLSIPAGKLVVATVSFKTGDQYIPYADTAFMGSLDSLQPQRYNTFQPLMYEQNTSGYLTYTPGNWNMGLVKYRPDTSGLDSIYTPALHYTASFGPEFPCMNFRLCMYGCPPLTTTDINLTGNLAVWPNPAGDQVNIQFTEAPGQRIHVSLIDSRGLLVKEQVYDTKDSIVGQIAPFNLQDVAPGLYLIRISSALSSIVRKVIVSH